jgi:hypothetical protein
MEPEDSLPCSQKPSTGLYLKPGGFSPYPHRNHISLTFILILSSHQHLMAFMSFMLEPITGFVNVTSHSSHSVPFTMRVSRNKFVMSRPTAQYIRRHVNDSHVELCLECRLECGITAFTGSNYCQYHHSLYRTKQKYMHNSAWRNNHTASDAHFVPKEQNLHNYNKTSFDNCKDARTAS